MARARACIDACERYILVDEKSVPYADINDERQVKLKVHFKKRFVAYNN